MAFTGKATYSAGTALPELAEDVSDLIGIVSPYETPLLDALGDPLRAATSTHHEWLEDELLPNKDAINDATWSDPGADTQFDVDHGSRFRVGDQIQVEGSEELMLVTAVSDNSLTVVRSAATPAPQPRTSPTTRSSTSWAMPLWKAPRNRTPASPIACGAATTPRSSRLWWKSAAPRYPLRNPPWPTK